MATNKKINQFIYLTRKYFRTYLGIAIAVVLFIQFFQPFTIERFDIDDKWLFITGFGLIVLCFLLISQIIFQNRLILSENEPAVSPIFLPLYYVFLISTTSLSFIFYIHYVGENSVSFNMVVRVIFICLSLPVTMNLRNLFFSYQARIKKLFQESRSMQEKLKKFSENYTHRFIELISENDSDNLRIQVSEIIYAKSADNYVEIGYHDEEGVKKKMIRNTLRNIELELRDYNNFIRIHRTCLVNIEYINKLNKNFNAYWLSLENTKVTLPVSRQYLMAVKELM